MCDSLNFSVVKQSKTVCIVLYVSYAEFVKFR